MPNWLKEAGKGIEGTAWVLLHLIAHLLLIVGVIVTLLDSGIKQTLTYIRQVQDGLISKIGAQ